MALVSARAAVRCPADSCRCLTGHWQGRPTAGISCSCSCRWLIIQKVRNCIDKSCPIHVHTCIQLLVNKADLECLVTEAMMLKEFLPKVLTPEYLTSFSKLTQIDQGA